MLGKSGLLILAGVALSTAPLDRIHKILQDTQDYPVTHEKSCKSCLSFSPQTGDVSIEVFQVLDLPLNIHEASLTKTERGGQVLKLSLGNSSDVKIIGLRYSIVSIDARNEVQIRVNRTEGFSVPAYGTKTVTFKTPIRLKQRDGERLILMIEQVVSRESIWEVVKAKEALESYARGDYSILPTVLRVPNQVDSPPAGRQIRFERD